jgi:putative ABC transport system ATP-binding protein
MLKLTDVMREYRVGPQTVHALKGVSMEVAAGQFVSIVGPSGAGKSTMLHMLGALDSPDSGSIRFEEREIGNLRDDQQSEFRRNSVGFIFQFFNLLPTLSAWENVAVPKLLGGTAMRKARPRALELLDLVGLARRADHRPAELSGGEMQRVAVARALVMDPKLILADEPTGNLDSKTGAEIISVLGEVARATREKSVIVVTHNSEVAAASDRIITLQDGRISSDEIAEIARALS